jgi:hypothetical protein
MVAKNVVTLLSAVSIMGKISKHDSTRSARQYHRHCKCQGGLLHGCQQSSGLAANALILWTLLIANWRFSLTLDGCWGCAF